LRNNWTLFQTNSNLLNCSGKTFKMGIIKTKSKYSFFISRELAFWYEKGANAEESI